MITYRKKNALQKKNLVIYSIILYIYLVQTTIRIDWKFVNEHAMHFCKSI